MKPKPDIPTRFGGKRRRNKVIRTVSPLPMAVEDIDRDWLTAALRTRART